VTVTQETDPDGRSWDTVEAHFCDKCSPKVTENNIEDLIDGVCWRCLREVLCIDCATMLVEMVDEVRGGNEMYEKVHGKVHGMWADETEDGLPDEDVTT
jgi:hypothetical protein